MPTTRSIPRPANGVAMLSIASLNPSGVAQQRRDVVKQDPGLREIRNVADLSPSVRPCMSLSGCENRSGDTTALPARRRMIRPARPDGPRRSASSTRSTEPGPLRPAPPRGRPRDYERSRARPSRDAAASANMRKPTPCTRPPITYLRATIIGDDGRLYVPEARRVRRSPRRRPSGSSIATNRSSSVRLGEQRSDGTVRELVERQRDVGDLVVVREDHVGRGDRARAGTERLACHATVSSNAARTPWPVRIERHVAADV